MPWSPIRARLVRRAVLLVAAAAVGTWFAVLVPGGRAAVAALPVSGWHVASYRLVPAAHVNQGVVSLDRFGRTTLVFRGDADVPAVLHRQGWWHIGAPGSVHGYLLDAFQARRRQRAKLFTMTDSAGRRTLWRHTLAQGEMVNNSFAAVAPSGQWFLSGEWGAVSRLLQFPTPVLNRAVRSSADLPTAAPVTLTRRVRNVQGCSFATAVRLICATNDSRTDLFPVARQLLSIQLSRPLDGRPQTATPTLLGPVPQLSRCGLSETEGLDVHGDRLTLVTNEAGACARHSIVLTLTARNNRPTGHASVDNRADDIEEATDDDQPSTPLVTSADDSAAESDPGTTGTARSRCSPAAGLSVGRR